MDARTSDPGSNGPLCVLLVDDAQIILDRLASTLGRVDNVLIVGQSNNSADAISKIDQLSPDLVVLDIQLKDSDGFDVLQYVAYNKLQVRVFVFSNNSSDDSRARFTTGGADRFFDKSLDFGALRSAVLALSTQGHAR